MSDLTDIKAGEFVIVTTHDGEPRLCRADTWGQGSRDVVLSPVYYHNRPDLAVGDVIQDLDE